MGGGIAQVSAHGRLPHRGAGGRRSASWTRASAAIKKFLIAGVEKGKVTQADMDKTLGNLKGTTEVKDLADCDLVVEAITENLAARRRCSRRSTARASRTRSSPRTTSSLFRSPR